ncbi:hypothetical protein LO772_09205 [Yinghuangia sp. ASG 101]|uniref:hypothetical protein n=1 Tax=Yinghuangia sp. ASG 101 TaxID=2896848 RepID=UPI001E4EFD70|nr:hypothetical protein [Yinghuangia sp. ASG 101]UGQ13750.1 hypothetical protein LO772_09205 [Yinghuangia sp. ASG 101]
MTWNPPHSPDSPARARSAADLRRRLAWWAIAACAPYLTLKLLWIVGVDIGIVDTGKISRGQWIAANLLTFVMDAVAAAVAHALTRPRIKRGRSWPILLPLWIASGLLGVIMIAVPLSCGGALVGGSGNPFAGDDLLRGWVYAVVYSGFIIEGTVLIGAFALYAHERWGDFLRTRVRDLPALPERRRPLIRYAGVLTALLLLTAAAPRLLWASGGDLGMTDAWTANRDTNARWLDFTQGVLALVGCAGTLALVLGRGGCRTRVPLSAAWVGIGGTFGAGGWMGLISLTAAPGSEAADRTSVLLTLVYTAEMTTGLLALTAGWYFLSHSTAHTTNVTRTMDITGTVDPTRTAPTARTTRISAS